MRCARTSGRRVCTRPRAPRLSRPESRWWRSTSSWRRPASVQDAKRIASLIREGGAQGLPGLRAMGVPLRHAGNDARVGNAEGGARGGQQGSVGHAGDSQSKSPMPPPRAGDVPSGDVVAQTLDERRAPTRVAAASGRRGGAPTCRDSVRGARRPRSASGVRRLPRDVALPGFDPEAHVIENALGF